MPCMKHISYMFVPQRRYKARVKDASGLGEEKAAWAESYPPPGEHRLVLWRKSAVSEFKTF